MYSHYLLDTGILGQLVHPRPNKLLRLWTEELLLRGASIVIPEISDYELRRNLVLEGFGDSVHRLNELEGAVRYLPLDTKTMRLAADLWARARSERMPTARSAALDGDVILAAQAMQVHQAVVVTENVSHLIRFVPAKSWRDI